jgi:ASCH domain
MNSTGQGRKEAGSRLFVPLATDPYQWFLSGQKRWEVRRQRGAFSLHHVTQGRRVELRRGYSDYDSAVGWAADILRIDASQKVETIAFRVVLDKPGAVLTRIRFAREYRTSILSGQKATTVRRGRWETIPGPAILSFGPQDEVPAAITAVAHTTVSQITEAQAKRDGFSSRDELLTALKSHYSDLRDDESVTILEFKCLM